MVAFLSIPAVAWEVGPPVSIDRPDAYSRRQLELAKQPYQAAIPPEIAALEVSLSSQLAADVAQAEAALARFDSIIANELGQAVPGNLSTVLLRTESASSSQIEGISVRARGLAVAVLGADSSHNAELVARNVDTMNAALQLAGRLDIEAIERMHAILLSEQLGAEAGSVREIPVWIGGGNWPAQAEFVPPASARVPDCMADLTVFMRRADIPPLAHMAIAHAQFETIHPFSDGNGRTGRALVQAMARHLNVTRVITAPISAGLLRDTESYFGALDNFRSGDAGPIVEQFVGASLFAADRGTVLVQELVAERERMAALAGARAGSGAARLVTELISQPVTTVAHAQAALGVDRATAHRAIVRLEENGVLQEFSGRRRDRMWQARGVLEILDTFAESIRRSR